MKRLPDIERVKEALDRIIASRSKATEVAARRICGADAALLDEVLRLLPYAVDVSHRFAPPAENAWRKPSEEVGRVVGRHWKLLRMLGEGAEGAVYEATHVETGMSAAVKLVYAMSPHRIRLVRQEIAFLRWLRLPGVVRLLDDGVDGAAVFCVTELIEGQPFPGVPGPLPWERLEPLAHKLLDTVAAVHEAGIVHCDLKPSNVLVNADGRLTLLDLGISAEWRLRHAVARGASGTPAYAAPEQQRGAAPHARWDLFAIGVMLHEALAGRRPNWRDAAVCETGAPLVAPDHVCRLIASLLATRASHRRRSARGALDVLRPTTTAPKHRSRWTEIELRERFAGPDRLLHLREDGAAELLRRTGGRPIAVETEVASWLGTGIAHVDAGRIVIDRRALERLHVLRAIREHGQPSEREDRAFARMLRGGGPRATALAARRLAERRMAQGRPAAAISILFEGAGAARIALDEGLETDLLVIAATASLMTAASPDFERSLSLVQRAAAANETLAHLETVIRAALVFAAGRPLDAAGALAQVCEAAGDRRVLRLAWSVRNTVSRALGLDEERRCVRALRRWLRSTPIAGADAILATAEGWVAYHESKFSRAIRRHLEAAHRARGPHPRARCLLDAATAAVESDPKLALRLAERARRIASRVRNAVHEGQALVVLRRAAMRRRMPLAPDIEFVEAAQQLGLPTLVVSAAFGEAAIAWRGRDFKTARRLASAAGHSAGASPVGDFARALAAAAGERSDDATLRRCFESAIARLPVAVGMQTLALLGVARPAWRAELRRQFEALPLKHSDDDAARIREILSIDEARSLVVA